MISCLRAVLQSRFARRTQQFCLGGCRSGGGSTHSRSLNRSKLTSPCESLPTDSSTSAACSGESGLSASCVDASNRSSVPRCTRPGAHSSRAKALCVSSCVTSSPEMPSDAGGSDAWCTTTPPISASASHSSPSTSSVRRASRMLPRASASSSARSSSRSNMTKSEALGAATLANAPAHAPPAPPQWAPPLQSPQSPSTTAVPRRR
mmetsp:Transcript_54499/g.118822  ORF Transcript_54499/g.118822 Transcript_54499/m.118822 type:complete len:206 (-) Transcript_54499:2763-3380(-)